jgi:hypothetical protein
LVVHSRLRLTASLPLVALISLAAALAMPRAARAQIGAGIT